MQNIHETWSLINGYKEYRVINTGVIVSLKYGRKRVLKQEENKGYLRVTLSKNNIQKRFQVHVIVAKAFCSGFSPNKEVNHKDFNRKNNNSNNLEWVTRSQNEKHTYKHGRKRPPCYEIRSGFKYWHFLRFNYGGGKIWWV